MRTAAITVHNNQELEIFVETRKEGFELWIIGPIKGHRTLLDHHLTHDDLEGHLEYARSGDLVWHDAGHSQIPAAKHQNAVEMEDTIKRGTFCDFDDPKLDEQESLARQASGLPARSGPSLRSVAGHFSSIAFLVTDQKETNAAKQALLGRWTDGVATLTIQPNHKLQWSCTDRQHPLNVGEQIHKHAPDWWNFAMWRLALLNNEHQCGTHIGVLRVDERELHLFSNHSHRIADVFHRDKSAGH